LDLPEEIVGEDGIFATAIILMVFEIKLPTGTTPLSLNYELLRLWPRFLAYMISFIVLGVHRVGQHFSSLK
jgi:uncharacterized membrane protein